MEYYYHLEKSNKVVKIKDNNKLPTGYKIDKHYSFLKNNYPNEHIGMTDYKITKYYNREIISKSLPLYN